MDTTNTHSRAMIAQSTHPARDRRLAAASVVLMGSLLGGCLLKAPLGELEEDTEAEDTEAEGTEAEGTGTDTGNDSMDPGPGGTGPSGDSGDPGTEAPVEPPPPAGPWEVPPECAAVASESAYCLTVDWGGSKLIGVDSGSVCSVGPEPPNDYHLMTSYAWQGDSVVGCINTGGDFVAGRFDLFTGDVYLSNVQCQGITAYGEQLLVMGFAQQPSRIYDDVDAIFTNTPAAVLDFEIPGSRAMIDGTTLYSAWHSTDTIWRNDMVTGADLGDLPLADYDGWIRGMSLMNGVLLVLAPNLGEFSDDGLLRFDPTTGADLGGMVTLNTLVAEGLLCRPGTP